MPEEVNGNGTPEAPEEVNPLLEFTKNLLGFYGTGADNVLGPLVLSAEQYLKNAGVKLPVLPDDLPHAAAVIGEDGAITVTADEPGAAGDRYSIKVVVGDELKAEIEDGAITVTLEAEGSTIEDVVAAINEIDGVSAEGEGTGTITEAIGPVQFTGGATPEEAVYQKEYALYKIAVAARVKILHDGDPKGDMERTLTSIILQIKDYAGGEVI